MTIRITFGDKQAGRKFKQAMVRQRGKVHETAMQAARLAAHLIEERGRQNIAAAGNFGRRWLDGLKATVTQGGGNIRIRVTHDVPYWRVFQTGKVIRGKPLLWIPLSFADDAQGISAKDYPQPLFRVDRKVGAPLLLAPGGVPKYFGKEQVKIPKKFRLLEIAAEVSRDIGDIYRRLFRSQR